MKQLVRNLSILLVSCAAVTTAEWAQAEDSSAPSSKEERDEAKYQKKQAKDWVKQSIAKKKKALAALKKVKSQKTADASGKELQKLFGVSGKQDNEHMTAEEEKNKKVIERLDEQIQNELTRIGELNLNSSLLEDGIKEMNEAE